MDKYVALLQYLFKNVNKAKNNYFYLINVFLLKI